MLQKYRFYAGLFFAVLTVILFWSLWKHPGKLIPALAVVLLAAGGVFYYIQKRKESSIQLADRALYKSQQDDPELGATE